jgi:CRISPR-associated protein Cas6
MASQQIPAAISEHGLQVDFCWEFAMTTQTIDLAFIVIGTATLPSDHGYHLYAAVSRTLPAVHEPNGIGIHPIRGRLIGDRQMQLCEWSRLTIRVAAERIADFLPLAGKQLDLAGRSLRIGIPEVRSLIPATALRSRLVTIKNGTEPERFQTELRRKLVALRVSAEAIVTLGKRRTIRIKDKDVVGYDVLIEGLTAEESLAIQTNDAPETHLGFSRRHMGCGIFVPIRRGFC